MDTAALTKTAIALGVLFAASKFVPNPMVKAAAYGVMGVIVAKYIPFVQDAV